MKGNGPMMTKPADIRTAAQNVATLGFLRSQKKPQTGAEMPAANKKSLEGIVMHPMSMALIHSLRPEAAYSKLSLSSPDPGFPNFKQTRAAWIFFHSFQNATEHLIS